MVVTCTNAMTRMEKRKTKIKKLRLCLVTVFVFYFQKLAFENIKKKQFSCIFEIKNMFGQLKLKKEKNRKYLNMLLLGFKL